MRDHPQRQSQITRDVKVRFEADPNQSGFETNPDGGVDPAESGGSIPGFLVIQITALRGWRPSSYCSRGFEPGFDPS